MVNADNTHENDQAAVNGVWRNLAAAIAAALEHPDIPESLESLLLDLAPEIENLIGPSSARIHMAATLRGLLAAAGAEDAGNTSTRPETEKLTGANPGANINT